MTAKDKEISTSIVDVILSMCFVSLRMENTKDDAKPLILIHHTEIYSKVLESIPTYVEDIFVDRYFEPRKKHFRVMRRWNEDLPNCILMHNTSGWREKFKNYHMNPAVLRSERICTLMDIELQFLIRKEI